MEDEGEDVLSCTMLLSLCLVVPFWVSLCFFADEDEDEEEDDSVAVDGLVGRETCSPSSPKVMTLRFAD